MVVSGYIYLKDFKRRRFLYARWMKIVHYEFWPTALFYLPGFIYYLLLCIPRNRFGLLSIVNPGMLAAGVYQPPKVGVLQKLAIKNPQYIARCITLANKNSEEYFTLAKEFISTNKLSFPIILKPEVGQRGADIRIIKDQHELQQQLTCIPKDGIYMLQEYAHGIEYGVHYVRMPKEKDGTIFSIGRKELISLRGDGIKSLERLILEHPRACIMYKVHFRQHKEVLATIPAQGEKIQLVHIGTHSLGAIFVDARKLKTKELEKRIDQISKGYEGFYMGRYDIIAASEEDLQQGINFKVVELNSVMGEPAHMYDPHNSLWYGYKVLMQYCGLMVKVATQNMELGVTPMSFVNFISLSRRSYRELM